jgi:hypothetical protein
LYEGGKGKGAPQIGLRLPPSELASVDAWIREQPKPRPSRPVAIRRLVELGLTVGAKTKQAPAARADRARELAGQAIDKIGDPAAHPEERAHRRRRLTKGPEEFREVRVDRPKGKK